MADLGMRCPTCNRPRPYRPPDWWIRGEQSPLDKLVYGKMWAQLAEEGAFGRPGLADGAIERATRLVSR